MSSLEWNDSKVQKVTIEYADRYESKWWSRLPIADARSLLFSYDTQEPPQLFFCLLIWLQSAVFSDKNHHIQCATDSILVKTKEFSDETFYPVSVSRWTNFPAYYETEPMSLRFILLEKEDEVFGRDFLSKLHHVSEFLRMCESLSLGKLKWFSFVRHHQESWFLDGESFPSFHSPSSENVSSTPRAHSFEKTVSSLSFNIAWLIRPFHSIPLNEFLLLRMLNLLNKSYLNSNVKNPTLSNPLPGKQWLSPFDLTSSVCNNKRDSIQ